jgi:hypothetical protein
MTSNTDPRGTSENSPVSSLNPLGALDWSLKNVAGLSALSVALLYGVSRPAYDAFYNSLGFSPEDIGLTEAMIFFKTAVNVLRVLSFVIVLWVVSYPFANLYERIPKFGGNKWAIGGVRLVVAVLLVLGALWFEDESERAASIAGFAAVVGFGACIVVVFWKGKFTAWRAILLVGVLLVLSLGFSKYQWGAESQGREFLQRGEVRGVYGFVLSITYSEAQPIQVNGDPGKICGSPAQYLVLGHGDDNTYVLVRDDKLNRVVRVGQDDYRFNLALTRDRHPCEGSVSSKS